MSNPTRDFLKVLVGLVAWVAFLFAIYAINTHDAPIDSIGNMPACQTEDSVPETGSCIWRGGSNGIGNTVISHSNGTYTVIPSN